jgi:hypothetical protein
MAQNPCSTLKGTPTFAGSGKTFISVLLIKDKYNELRQSAGRKVVVFLAPFVALVLQVYDLAPDRAHAYSALGTHQHALAASQYVFQSCPAHTCMCGSQTVLTGTSPAQQLEVLRIHTDLRVAAYYGGVAQDSWTVQRWRHEVDTHHVLVMTPAVFKAALTHSFMTVTPL